MTFAHILYAALFRLAIIAAGISCVTMGYRLFVLGVMPKDGSQIDASTGEIRLSLKNAAPGTCFAAFGVFMIIVMLVQGIPEMKVIEVPTKNGIQREVTWRSDDEDIYTALMEGQKLERNDQLDKAIKAYAKPFNDGHLSLKEAAAPLRSIAGVYMKQERLEEAFAYATLSYQADPGDAGGLALIARIESQRGHHGYAVEAISKAAEMDATFAAERDRMKEQKP